MSRATSVDSLWTGATHHRLRNSDLGLHFIAFWLSILHFSLVLLVTGFFSSRQCFFMSFDVFEALGPVGAIASKNALFLSRSL